MKIIIAGAGEVGSHLIKMLAYEGHEITVIDVEPEALTEITLHLDLITIEGSALSMSILEDAKISECDLYIGVTHFPEMNIASAVIAKKLGAKMTIARIRGMETYKERHLNLFKEIGVDAIINPQQLAATEIAKFLRKSATREYFDFSDGKLSLFVIKIESDSSVIGKPLSELVNTKNGLDYRIVAINRNSQTIIPNGGDVLRQNDVVYVVSNKKGIGTIISFTGKKQLSINNIMIVGGSRIGRATAKLLQNQFNVKLIEMDKRNAQKLANVLDNTLVINGDGRNTDLLVEEGIRNMDAFIAVTGDSETNILSCILAKRLGVGKTIAEVENIDYLDLAESMGIDTIINKKIISASHIFKYTLEPEFASVKYLTNTEAEVFEIIVPADAKICEKPLKSINFPVEALIGGVVRDKEAFIATGSTQIKAHDKVLVISLPSVIQDVHKLFEKGSK
ncbi:MAG: Trk system potassium transporter TrkA [Bacteroidales bacterium]|nr:Trk system potassium transporter TrkA [Bacteroidales bacterium]